MDTSEFLRECAIHHRLRHPNIVQLLAICDAPLCVVTEFMGRGSLGHCLSNHAIDISWPLRVRFAADIARGMTYLHQCDVMHRDLKSFNVFIDDDWRCKVGDFGQAQNMTAVNTAMTGQGRGRAGDADSRRDVLVVCAGGAAAAG
jgi:serine/threonine protein kinase